MKKKIIIYQPSYIHPSAKIGKGTKIGAFCDIGKNVVIGEDCLIEAHVTISNGCKIGNHVFIGPNTSLLNDKYPVSNKITPVTIDDKVIIGGGVIILPNVHIHSYVIVGAGSVVTKDIPEGIVVWGNPARKHMTYRKYEKKWMKWIKSVEK